MDLENVEVSKRLEIITRNTFNDPRSVFVHRYLFPLDNKGKTLVSHHEFTQGLPLFFASLNYLWHGM